MRRPSESGFTLLEVAAALAIASLAVVPVLVVIGQSRTDTVDARLTRQMQYLLEYKLNEITKGVADPENTTWIQEGGEQGNFADYFFQQKDFRDMDVLRKEELMSFFYEVTVTEKLLPGLGADMTEEELAQSGYYADEDGGYSREFEGLDYRESVARLGGNAPSEESEPEGHRRFEVVVTILYDCGKEDANRRLSAMTFIPIPGEPEMPGAPTGEEEAGGGGRAAGTGSGSGSRDGGGAKTETGSKSGFTEALGGSGKGR